MDPSKNPYAPGAGNPPPELAGRDSLLEKVGIGLRRIKAGRYAKSFLLVGLRGVGKTVLLNRIAQGAEREKLVCLHIEAQEDKPLSSMLIPELHKILLQIGRGEAVKKAARHALNIIVGVAKSLQIQYQGMSIGLDRDFQPLAPAIGNLESDLSNVFRAVGGAIKKKNTAFVLLIDELQYAKKDELAALIVALHKCQQWQLPIMLVGAGLPQLVGNAGNAKSYAERMFDFPEIGKLDRAAALKAIEAPAKREKVLFQPAALDKILKQTECYPYFLQEWGHQAWQAAKKSPIAVQDIKIATRFALRELDQNFFRVRYDRCTNREQEYLAAMATLGAGRHRSGDIAGAMGERVMAVAPIRSNLIKKGMIYSPKHGLTEFTVPLFDAFMERAMS
ncbi:MAG: ATP-binding protein [Gammaproteobacteria bacterium]|nr:ATP-binding protein [Gammaproteobacteria bacterium]MDD9850902.1 ATP-binding protein [Gammaproteobacteria bacterium]